MAGRGQRPSRAPQSGVPRFKLVLLGDSGVGKSSLMLRFTAGEFDFNQPSTIGAGFGKKLVSVRNRQLWLDMWDTAGQERYCGLAPMYYHGTQIAIVVYDICSHDSFTRAQQWASEVKSRTSPDVVIAFVGNKADVEEGRRAVEVRDGQAYAEQHGLLFMETSARSGLNVSNLFLSVARLVAEREQVDTGQQRQQGLQLTEENSQQRKSRCCK